MPAEVIQLDSLSPDAEAIERAARRLADGGLVAFPTETVYGLAANAALPESVERLRQLKGRDPGQPFTVHLGRSEDGRAYVPDISPAGRRFIRKGWPGPLTLVFPVDDPESVDARGGLSAEGMAAIYAGNTVGLRHPDHPVAEMLVRQAGAPIIASSANVAGADAPVEADQIAPDMRDHIDIILDAGPTRYRKGSTIVSLNGTGYKIIRTGVWDERTIRRLSMIDILFVCTGNTCRSPIAEGLCRQMLAKRLGCRIDELLARGVHVHSAGTLGLSGSGVSPESVQACGLRGVDISGHTSTGLTIELIRPADHVFVMARHHLEAVRSIARGSADRASLLADEDIADPIGGSVDEYERIARLISDALEQRLQEVDV